MRHILADLAVAMMPKSYMRVTPMAHAATPLGAGFKVTRFAIPTKTFKVIYLAQDLTTVIAETLVRALLQSVLWAHGSFRRPHQAVSNSSRALTNWTTSASAEAPRPKARSTMRASPQMSFVMLKVDACPLRSARITSKPLIVA